MYQNLPRNRFSFYLQISVLASALISFLWVIELFPLSKEVNFYNSTYRLTGKTFWAWNTYTFEEWGVRNEGFTMRVFKFNSGTADYFSNPDSTFFRNYPRSAEGDKTIENSWTPTPVDSSDHRFIDQGFATYTNWDEDLINRQLKFKKLAEKEGSYYAYIRNDFYFLCPEKRLIVWINHNR